VEEAFKIGRKVWKEEVGKFEVKGDLTETKKGFSSLDNVAWSYYKMYPALQKLEEMYEPLWALHGVFEGTVLSLYS
jgi:hypothetical protein